MSTTGEAGCLPGELAVPNPSFEGVEKILTIAFEGGSSLRRLGRPIWDEVCAAVREPRAERARVLPRECRAGAQTGGLTVICIVRVRWWGRRNCSAGALHNPFGCAERAQGCLRALRELAICV